MFDPSMIAKAMALVTKCKEVTLTNCETLEGRDSALDRLTDTCEDSTSEVFTLALSVDGKPLFIVASGPAGSRAALGF